MQTVPCLSQQQSMPWGQDTAEDFGVGCRNRQPVDLVQPVTCFFFAVLVEEIVILTCGIFIVEEARATSIESTDLEET